MRFSGPVRLGCAILFCAGSSQATEFFVDDIGGNDQNDGKASTQAWKTLSQASKQVLAAGDTVRFRAGGKWDAATLGSNGWIVKASGASGSPITFSSFGSGDKPIIENTTSSTPWVRSFTLNGDFLVLDGLKMTTSHENGVNVAGGADDILIQNCEFEDVGTAVLVRGARTRVVHNYFHDLHMVVNTQGGDDDNGAVAVGIIDGTDTEVAYNRMERCKAPSYDYGTDGGAVELYAEASTSVISGTRVHHNFASDTDGFLEVGGQGGTVQDAVFSYNVSVRNRLFGFIHNASNFAVKISGFSVTNNTIVEIVETTYSVIGFTADVTPSQFSFDNNIVVLGDYGAVFTKSGYSHDHNLYFFQQSKTVVGAPLSANEIQADPAFVNLATDDFHLLPASPAIDKGADFGFKTDFDDLAVPEGAAPDIGAYEWHANPPDAGSGGTSGAGVGGNPGSDAAAGGSGTGGAPSSGGGASSKGGASAGGTKASSGSESDDGGCGCRNAGRDSESAWISILFALALGYGRRRR